MNLELAHTMLRKHGYSLELRDVKKGSRTFCYIIANSGYDERFLCNMRTFSKIGAEKFGKIVETRINQ